MLQYSPLLFFLPLLHGGFSTLYRLFLIIWTLHLLIIWTLHLLITWTPTWVPIPSDILFSPLWVAAVKATLFKGLLHINAAKKVAAMHLMWWWQLFHRYFEFSSLSHVQGAHFNRLNIHLVWVCRVRGEVPPRTFFPLSPNAEACKVDRLSHISLLGLVSVLGQGPRLNTLFWAIVPTFTFQVFVS